MRIIATVLSVVVMLAGPAVAGEKAGVRMPDTIAVAGKTLKLDGMGLREATMFKVNVYVAGLYVETPSSDPARLVQSNQTKVLTLHFVRDVDRGDIVKARRDGFKNNNPAATLATIQTQIDQPNSWMGDFSEGDELTFTYIPGDGVYVDAKGKRKGTLKGDAFARSLVSIWLGPQPPNGALKKGLLGSHGAAS